MPLFVLLGVACLFLNINSFAQTSAIGKFNFNTDIGDSTRKGNATYIPFSELYVVTGSGYNVWFDRDEFHYVYKKMKGDFRLSARAEFIGRGTDPHRKIGWMVRRSLDPSSAHVNAVVHGDGLTSLQFRRNSGAETEEIKSSITHADQIEIERRGNLFTMKVSKNGEAPVLTSVRLADPGDELFIGLFVSSHNKDVLETGVFYEVETVSLK